MSSAVSRNQQDQQIIDLLRRDVRITRRRLAEETELPESTIRTRLDRILRSGRVQPTVLVHPQLESSGFVYMLHLRLTPGADAAAMLLHPALADAPWAAQVADSGEFLVQQRASNPAEIADVVDRIGTLGHVERVWSVIVFRVYVGGSWRGGGAYPESRTSEREHRADDIDLSLIAALRRDGRASYTDLAAVTKLTVAATRRRVLRLTEDGVIRFTARFEDDSPAFEASLDLEVPSSDVHPLVSDLCALPTVKFVTEQSGRANVACYLTAPDGTQLAAAVERVRGDPRVERAHVSPVIRVRDLLTWEDGH
ncbi:MAG: transcriptional regulator, AsnC family [Microbacterium sp.]|jgi:DNA-binding Lrp family transcriptional regulator|nr:transcriptional regulator, AsnC family [Microbacterium sp.]